MITSFSALDIDFPSIALIVLTVLWDLSYGPTFPQALHFCLLCSFVILLISSFICYMEGEVWYLDLRSSRALIFSNISVGTCSVLGRCLPEGMWCGGALRMMARKIFCLFFGSWSEAVFCDIHLQSNKDW